MSGLADVRPDAADLLLRPATTIPVTLEGWPAGSLAGRTFTSTLDGESLDLTVVGDTIVVEASAALTGALEVGVAVAWQLLEEIDGTPEPILIGTWTPDDGPRAVSSATLQVSVGAATIQVTVNSAQASIAALDARVDQAETDITALEAADVALDGRLDTAEASLVSLDGRLDTAEGSIAGHETRLDAVEPLAAGTQAALTTHEAGLWEHGRPRVLRWDVDDDWDAWHEVVVSSPADSTPVLTADGGAGVITGSAPAGEDDRRIWVLDDPDLLDGTAYEVYVDLEGAQTGIALLIDEEAGVAVIVWVNIFFFATGTLIGGVWEWDPETDTWLAGNEVGQLPGFKSTVRSASGDGTRVTVRTDLPHGASPGSILHFDATVDAFAQVTVERVIDETTFTFLSATTGAWTGGTYRWVVAPAGRRRVGIRLDRATGVLTWKQWLPHEDEPAWDDSLKALTGTLPATLAISGEAPPISGPPGVLAAHLGGEVRFSDLQVTRLDVTPSLAAVTPDDTRAALGEVAARVDLLKNPSNPGVLWVGEPGMFTASVALVNGTLYLAKIPVPADRDITTIFWHVAGLASGVTAGQNWLGLYSLVGTRLAQVGIDSAITSAGLKTTALAASVDAPHVLAALLVNASTPPSVLRMSTALSVAMANVGMPAPLLRFASGGTGLTALPSTITPASLAASPITGPWAALS